MLKKFVPFGFLLIGFQAYAAPITITGYDILNATISGSGGWSHNYSGTITNTGPDTANYTGGSGTLNNGVVENTHSGSQLFNWPNFHAPIITLYLDDFYTIDDITLDSGDWSNTIPGTLTGLDLSIGAVTDSFLTVEPSAHKEFVDLSGSALNGLVTNTLVLSGFTSTWSSFQTFNISEITLNGVQTNIPEPTVLALMGVGLAGLGFARRKNKAQA